MFSTALSAPPQVLPLKFTIIPFLVALRQAVIEHSDYRMPKWKFRAGLELVFMLQPSVRLTNAGLTLQLFTGEALQADGFVTAEMFTSSAALDNSNLNWWRVKFNITAPAVPPFSQKEYAEEFKNLQWTCNHRGGGWKASAGREGYDSLKARVASLFLGDFFDGMDASKLLFPHCLICGRVLTDPASMARFIGPECAGTSSLVVPGLIANHRHDPLIMKEH
jgi:hypothetical protein